MTELLQSTLEIPFKGDLFIFKIPSIHDDLRVGGRIRALRTLTDPDWSGFGGGLDADTAYALRAAATFEVLLQKGPAWVFTAGTDEKPIVDTSKIPIDKNEAVYEVYSLYGTALDSFRGRGNLNKDAAGEKAVASGQDPQ